MPTHETVRQATQGQVRDVAGTLAGAIPDLTFDEAKALTGDKKALMSRVEATIRAYIRELLPPQDEKSPGMSAIPKLGEIFELTIDFDQKDPVEIAQHFRKGPREWEFRGAKPTGKKTIYCKLVPAGRQPNFKAVREALALHGTIPSGLFLEAFHDKYRTPDDKGVIAVADPSWVGIGGRAFPILGVGERRWYKTLSPADLGTPSSTYRWLVACEEQPAPQPILHRVYPDEKIVVGATDGTKTMAKAEDIFIGYFDAEFKRMNKAGRATEATNAAIYDVQRDATFEEMFGSLGDPNTLIWEQSQIIRFCTEHRAKLRYDGYASLFLFKVEDKFFVARVRGYPDRLGAGVSYFANGVVWSAENQDRVVVPELNH